MVTEDIDNQWQSKMSFSRFGDELSELILDYLAIEEKFRFECLSKQIQKSVFQRHKVLRITTKDKSFGHKLLTKITNFEYRLKTEEFEKCLKKLKNLSELEIEPVYIEYVRSLHLDIVAKNCLHLKKFSVALHDYLSYGSIRYFGRKCGPKLEELSLHWSYISTEDIRDLLSFTPNLVSLHVFNFDIRFILGENNDKLLPNLRKLSIDGSLRIEELSKLQDIYNNRLQVFNTLENIVYIDSDELILLISGL